MLLKLSRFFALASLFTFLIPPRGNIFGLFLRHELFFQMMVSIAAVCWLLSLWGREEKGAEGVVRFSWVDISVAALFFAFLLAMIFSPVPARSFFGLLDRLTGFLNLAYAGMLYVLVRVLFKRQQDLRNVLIGAALSSGLVAIYALLQNAGVIDSEFGLAVRPVGSFTNPALLGGYLVIGAFLAFFGYASSASYSAPAYASAIFRCAKATRITLFACAVVASAAVIATETRSAILGLVAGFSVLCVGALLSRRFSKRIRIVSGIVIGIFLIAAAALAVQIFFAPFRVEDSLLSRISNPEHLLSGIQNRVISWKTAVTAWRDRPVTGWGLDNFTQAFDAHFDTALVRRGAHPESWFDKAHNVFLEMLSTAGLVGFGAYVIFLGTMLAVSWRRRRDNPALLVLVALIIAYGVHGLFIFDSLESFALLFVLAAIVSSVSLVPGGGVVISKVSFGGWRRFVVRAFGICASAVTIYALVAFTIVPLWGMGRHYYGWKKLNERDIGATAFYAQDFHLRHPYSLWAWERVAILLLNNKDTFSDDRYFYDGMIRFAFEEFAVLEGEYVPTARDYYMAGRIGNFMKDAGQEDRERALRYLERARALAPRTPDIYYEFAQYYKNSKEFDRALVYLRQALDIDPLVAFTHMNLGLAYVAVRDFDNAIKSFERTFELGYDGWKEQPGYINLLIQIYTIDKYLNQYMPRLVEFYEALVRLEPDNVENYVRLAAVYKELGSLEKAREMALKAIEIDPRVRAQAEEFLKTLQR